MQLDSLFFLELYGQFPVSLSVYISISDES